MTALGTLAEGDSGIATPVIWTFEDVWLVSLDYESLKWYFADLYLLKKLLLRLNFLVKLSIFVISAPGMSYSRSQMSQAAGCR